MGQRIVQVFLLMIGMISCLQHQDKNDFVASQELPHLQLDVKYAKGFKFHYTAQYTKITTRSLDGNTTFEDSIFILHDVDHKLIKGSKVINSDLKSICCQSSTHLAYIHFFHALNTVAGLCGMRYLENREYMDILRKADTKEICIGEALQLETVLSVDPNIYFVHPFSAEENKKVETCGINMLVIAEYLEQHPIARLEWIKVFGLIFHQEKKANDYFESVEKEYYELVQEEKDKNKRFILNLPYGQTWFSPSSNSLIVKLLEDAGLYYHYQDETGTENTPHSKEKVWEAGAICDYWIIVANRPVDFSMEDLLREDEAYCTFKSVQNQQVIFCNSLTSDYFLDGVIEPQIMLKDILYAIRKIDKHTPKYFHLLK